MTSNNRPSLYAEVTARIIAELEEGRVPWVQPWDRAPAAAGLPRNAGTGRAYSGNNILILWAATIERGYGGQGWLTYVSLSLAAPEFGPRRLYANLGRAPGGEPDRFAIIWTPAD